jgi:hypothetical protein
MTPAETTLCVHAEQEGWLHLSREVAEVLLRLNEYFTVGECMENVKRTSSRPVSAKQVAEALQQLGSLGLARASDVDEPHALPQRRATAATIVKRVRSV